MSKGMNNLYRMSGIANKKAKILMHVGYNTKQKECTLTDDKDCLPADLTNYREAEFDNFFDLGRKVVLMENKGYKIFINASYLTYETEVE
jgi:hypothetical protein